MLQDSKKEKFQRTLMWLWLGVVLVASWRHCCWQGRARECWYWSSMIRLVAAATLLWRRDMSLIQVALQSQSLSSVSLSLSLCLSLSVSLSLSLLSPSSPLFNPSAYFHSLLPQPPPTPATQISSTTHHSNPSPNQISVYDYFLASAQFGFILYSQFVWHITLNKQYSWAML